MRKNEIQADFRSFAMLMNHWNKKNVKNVGIINQLLVRSVQDCLQYSIERSDPLIFLNPDIERHSYPLGLDTLDSKDKSTEIHLIINIKEDAAECVDCDPILDLGVSIKIVCEYIKDNDVNSAICSWHLDRDSGKSSEYCHPLYHMNFGGDNMNEYAKRGKGYFGNLLLLPNPRIVHPPLDLFLACDFVIRNFYKNKTHAPLTTLPAYRNIIKRAADRYWNYYANAFASNWNRGLNVKNLTYQQLLGLS